MANFKIAIYADLEMKEMKYQFTIFHNTKIVAATNDCIQITPLNVLGNIQKEILKFLPPVTCKNLMKLRFCKELVGEAMSILQQPGSEFF